MHWIVILRILLTFVDGIWISWHHYVDFESQVACSMHALPFIMYFNLKFLDGFVNFAPTNAFRIQVASKYFCVNKASALDRHFAHSFDIC